MEIIYAILIFFLICFMPVFLIFIFDWIKKAKNYDKDISAIEEKYKKQIDLILKNPINTLIKQEINESKEKNTQQYNDLNNNEIIWQLKERNCNLKIELRDKEKKIEQLKNEIEKIKEEKIKDKLYACAESFVKKEEAEFDDLIVHLTMKYKPAFSSAEKVKEARNVAKEFALKYKQMKYEYDFLFQLFPELEDYIDKYKGEKTTLEELEENYDCSRKYLSKEEYEKCSEEERNQLALNRYIEAHNKSKWQIGRDYELYIGYKYTIRGYQVQYFGISQKLEDMGRDIIAENEDTIHIIQCKYWSKDKIIHEKHICQLYGTTIQYKKKTKTKKKIIPVFITKTKLSETAKDFAKYLNVKFYEDYEIDDFPRIKCNIGKNKEKIYHLPFDQKYDDVIIEKSKGEFFAFTVKEAIDNGYRRAKKWMPRM